MIKCGQKYKSTENNDEFSIEICDTDSSWAKIKICGSFSGQWIELSELEQKITDGILEIIE